MYTIMQYVNLFIFVCVFSFSSRQFSIW